MIKKKPFLIGNAHNICNESCPTKSFFNILRNKFIDINEFIDTFYVPFEATTDVLTSIKILFIGEAPGEKEAIHGRPFYPYASSGLILRRAIKDLNIEHYAIANIVSCRPVYLINKKFRNRIPAFNECQYCSCYLKNFILSLNKNLKIILLGKTAAFTILGGTEYAKKHTTIFPLVKLLPYKYKERTYGINFHPKYIQYGNGIQNNRYKDYILRMKEIINA